jgi:hypothetical protein
MTEMPVAPPPADLGSGGAAVSPPQPAWRVACALLAVAAGLWGCRLIQVSPLSALLVFAVGGVLLYVAVDPRDRAQVAVLRDQPHARQGWEPWFALLLIAGSISLYTWRLGDLPQGAIYSEAFLANSTGSLVPGPYVAHDSSAGTPWPTLYHYQSYLFGKYFGWKPASLRLTSAFYAFILVLALWLLARQVTSPGTAAIVALLWLGFHYSFHFARRYSPVGMSAMPAILALGLALIALRSRKQIFFAGAGAVAAIGLHTYFPGRLVPVLFAPFVLWAWLERDRLRLARRHFVAFGLAFAVVAAPIVAFSLSSKNLAYSGYVDQNSIFTVTGAKSVFNVEAYRGLLMDQAEKYLLMFHVLGEHDGQEDNTFNTPVLDPVLQVLAPLGLFVAVMSLAEGVPAVLVLGFLLGILPGMFIRLGVPPWPRRGIMSFPFAYLLAGVAIEYLRLCLTRGRGRWATALFFAVALATTAWLGQRMIAHYEAYASDPQFREFSNNTAWYANEEMLAHPKAKVLMADVVRAQPSSGVIIYSHNPVVSANMLRDLLNLDTKRDNLLLLGPWFEGNLPILQALYPHAVLRVYRDPQLADEATLGKELGNLGYEFFNPAVFLNSVLVPAADAAAMRGLLDEGPHGKGALQSVFSDHGLEPLAGKSVRLGGDLFVDVPGTTLTVNLPQKALHVSIGGRSLATGRPTWVPGGLQRFVLEGSVPAGSAGPLALQLQGASGDMVALNRLVPIHLEHGWHVDAFPIGPNGDKLPGKAVGSWHTAEAVTLFQETYAIPCPQLLVMSAKLHATEKGIYHFRAHWPARMPARVFVDNSLANDRWTPEAGAPYYGTDRPVTVDPAKPPVIRIEYFNRCLEERLLGVSLQMLRPGQTAWEEVPWAWLDPQSTRDHQ